MHVVLAWFADRSAAPPGVSQGLRRFDDAVSSLVPDTYERHDEGGGDWGVVVLHPPATESAWRWDTFAANARVTAISLGVPVGADVAGGPIALAQRLLNGDDVHADVVPPFGLMALGDAGFALQQDWLGMCRVFTGEADGVTAFCSRPTLLANFLSTTVTPHDEGWGSYAVCGHFGGDSSPVDGVRLLGPGERVTGRQRASGGWDLRSHTRFSADDLVLRGIGVRERGSEEAIELAAQGLISAATGVHDLYGGPITLGLSGGKDSRLIAASFIAAGHTLKFNTNVDEPAEGEIATILTDILRDQKGLEPEHQLVRAGTQEAVNDIGLRERIRRLQLLYDYQFPSTFVVRWPGPERLPAAERPLSLTGAGGELAVGYWYPRTPDGDGRETAETAVFAHLFAAVNPSVVVESALAREHTRIVALLDHGETLGLEGVELVDYVYLMERCRRWYTSAYFVGMVTPFLAPGFVAASFALSPDQKRARVLHSELLQRFMPEWTDVPYFTGKTARSTAARIWDGDGVEVLHTLLDTTHGDLTHLLRRDVVATTLVRCATSPGTAAQEKTLQQFACLAAASQNLEPHGVSAAAQPLAHFLAANARPPVPTWVSSIAPRLRFLKATRLGNWIWTAVRTRTMRGSL